MVDVGKYQNIGDYSFGSRVIFAFLLCEQEKIGRFFLRTGDVGIQLLRACLHRKLEL